MNKILFLVQKPNQGGLSNLINRWSMVLKKYGYWIDIKIVEENNYSIKNYDLVHLFFSPFYSKNLFCKLILKKIFSKKRNIVLTYYNLKDESRLKLFLRKILIKISVDKLALPSNRMVTYYKNLGIKNIFPLLPIVPKESSKKIKVRKDYISYFGALREDKGIDNLIYISKIIPEKIYSAGFVVGGESSKNYLEIIESSDDFVVFKGNHLNLVSRSKIVLFPYENLYSTIDMPLALLEAMSMRTAILTSNIPPLNKFLPRECLVNDWKNKKEVLEKISYLKRNNDKVSRKLVKIFRGLELDEASFIKNYCKLFFK
jgi:glycosyltransferase involved in cell wall biosynthesis